MQEPPDLGIGTGSLTCTQGDGCPGEAPTIITCGCSADDEGDDDSIFDVDDQ